MTRLGIFSPLLVVGAATSCPLAASATGSIDHRAEPLIETSGDTRISPNVIVRQRDFDLVIDASPLADNLVGEESMVSVPHPVVHADAPIAPPTAKRDPGLSSRPPTSPGPVSYFLPIPVTAQPGLTRHPAAKRAEGVDTLHPSISSTGAPSRASQSAAVSFGYFAEQDIRPDGWTDPAGR